MSAIGILTAGGDCPGLNAVIRGVVVRASEDHDRDVVGIQNGWEGLMQGKTRILDRDDVRGILARGGTILGTSRMDPYVHGDGADSVRKTLRSNGIDTLIVVGGDGTLRTALRLSQDAGIATIGVPKTIDNDIPATELTFGFDTAVEIATDAIDRLSTTAESHNRVMLLEVMGRTKGWIATYAGIAGGADAILIPEVPYDLEQVADVIRRRYRRGRSFSIVVIAEGVEPPEPGDYELRKDQFGFERLGGVAYQFQPLIEELTGFETRVTVLGHIQRGGSPTAWDRVLATRLGVAAADYAAAGKSGVMTALRSMDIVPVPLEDACSGIRGVDEDLYEVATAFFG